MVWGTGISLCSVLNLGMYVHTSNNSSAHMHEQNSLISASTHQYKHIILLGTYFALRLALAHSRLFSARKNSTVFPLCEI